MTQAVDQSLARQLAAVSWARIEYATRSNAGRAAANDAEVADGSSLASKDIYKDEV